ncbi:MAG: NFACT family protein, partial [Thermomicrobiales bacterium]|nr:NFACT family protein [Thermomicrobiales bacterium]
VDATNKDDNAEPTDDDIEVTATTMYVELMGRRSNIILVDEDGLIMDAIKRVTPEMSRVRPIRPRQQYVGPPPQVRRDPLNAHQRDALDTHEPVNVERWLIATYDGMSPLLAREAAWRAGVEPKDDVQSLDSGARDQLASAVRAIFAPLATSAWSPWIYRFEDGRIDFSSIPLESLKARPDVEAEAASSVVNAAEVAARAARTDAAPQRHAARRERLIAEIDQARSRVESRLHSLQEQAERATEIENWRAMGEAIYIHLVEIQPRQTELVTTDGLVIPLDPSLSASQNAQEYFERYRKAQSAEQNLPELLEKTQHELDYIEQVRSMAMLADGFDEIEAVRLEWAEQQVTAVKAPSRANRPRPSRQARRPRTYRTRFGDMIIVGRTGPQNEQVTFDIAGPDDIWLHARNMPGAHVILRNRGEVHEAALETAAALAAWYSHGRESTSVEVDATDRRNVRKIKGSGPGMVTYRNERTLNVRPSEQQLSLESIDSDGSPPGVNDESSMQLSSDDQTTSLLCAASRDKRSAT